MNPYAGVVLSAYEVWNMQYNVLVNLSADDMSPIPELATSWERSPDGLTWTFHLRDDMKWSDGKPLTSEDVAYTFDRTRDEEWSNFSPFTEGFTEVTDTGRDDGRHHDEGARPAPAEPPGVHPPEARVGEVRTEEGRQLLEQRPGHLRPVPAHRLEQGQLLRDDREPELLRGQAGGRQGAVPRSSATTRRWPRR